MTSENETGSQATSGASSQDADSAGPKPQSVGLALDWHRAIFIDARIDDDLVKRFAPDILRLKQTSGKPITVAVDSQGGSIPALEALISLLKAPDQDGNTCQVYTVVTNRAYSAAANLLALGDYAVAFPHAQILYHDLRYSGLEDVTPAKALRTAKQLEEDNDRFALKLAHHIARRFVWTYIDIRPSFEQVRKRYPKFVSDYEDALAEVLPEEKENRVDIVGFALALFQRLSSPADTEIAIGALNKLQRWIHIERIEKIIPTLKTIDGKKLDLMEGINALYRHFAMQEEEDKPQSQPQPEAPIPELALNESIQDEIKLLLELIVRKAVSDGEWSIGQSGLDSLAQDFRFIRDMNANYHIQSVTNLLVEHDLTFVGRPIKAELDAASTAEERNRILSPVFPQAKLFWHYIVLLCRAMFEGDHLLTPADAQVLGIVDEVLGGGPIESRREYRKRRVEEQKQMIPPPS